MNRHAALHLFEGLFQLLDAGKFFLVRRDPVAVTEQLFVNFGNLDAQHLLLRRNVLERLAAMIQQRAFAVLLEDRPKRPAVTVEVGQRVFELRVEIDDVRQELVVGGQHFRVDVVGVRHLAPDELFSRWF